MRHPICLVIFAFAQLPAFALDITRGRTFVLKDEYIGASFLDRFDFFSGDDPTHGRVNYVSKDDALRKNLVSAQGTHFVMRADSRNVVAPGARGRDSIRIQSQASYGDSITVLDLLHMPEGCATWPAFWTLSAKGPWPRGGEIDIIEGVNKNSRNLVSLHTTPACTMPERDMTGDATSTNCDAQVNFNQGCGVNFTVPFSYGSGFNQAKGGWYAMRRTAAEGISVWFWSRRDSTVPDEIRHGRAILDPDSNWGTPDAFFPFGSLCTSNHFDEHAIVFDDTFCGDFAGALYPTSGCPGTCVDFVDNNPEAFVNAYWHVNALRVYTPLF